MEKIIINSRESVRAAKKLLSDNGFATEAAQLDRWSRGRANKPGGVLCEYVDLNDLLAQVRQWANDNPKPRKSTSTGTKKKPGRPKSKNTSNKTTKTEDTTQQTQDSQDTTQSIELSDLMCLYNSTTKTLAIDRLIADANKELSEIADKLDELKARQTVLVGLKKKLESMKAA